MIISGPSLRRVKKTYKHITSKINLYTVRSIDRIVSNKGSLSKRSFSVLESQLGLIIIVSFSLVMNISIASAKNNVEDISTSGRLTGISPEAVAEAVATINKYTPLIETDKEKIIYSVVLESDTNYVGTTDNFATNITPPDAPVPVAEPIQRTKTTNYTVQGGDTLSQVAEKFNLSLDTLKYTNDITNNDQLKLGQTLKIPVNNLTRTAIAKAQNQQSSQKKTLAYSGRNTVGRDLPSYSSNFNIPVSGYSMISQGFGHGHTGVDYATPVGTSVHAAAGGVVIEADSFGWNYGWGKTILISHGSGVTSRYGHLSHLNVSVGDHVSGGELIGKSGNTGHSTGPHLHFQKDINGRAVYPY